MVGRADTTLLTLQGNIKREPESYSEEFELQFRHYKSCCELFSLSPSDESAEFGALVTFIAQVAPCYPDRTQGVVQDVSALLDKHYAVMRSPLRHTLVKALILLRNRGQVAAMELMPLLFRLFKCQDKSLRQLIFRHIIADIKSANQKGQNDQLNRQLQSFLYGALEDAHEGAAKKALAVLTELWRRQIWRDARTANVIAKAAVHRSARIMRAALKFFLGQDEAGEGESDEEDARPDAGLAPPTQAEVYRATKKGTASSKKKKEKKLQRVLAAVKRQQRRGKRAHENFAAIQLIYDPQTFAEELLRRLHRGAGERWEARLAVMAVISRVVGVHRLLLLNFYPLLQKFVLPHQRDAPQLLAILVQAVHEDVPPDALAPILRQLVDQFVHDRARPEVMTLGLKTVRELCERAPLVMTPELLQDLALYKKFREKEVATAARGLISLFRELAPGMLEKRDRGRDADAAAAPLPFGARHLADRIPGAELLQAELRGDADGNNSEEDGDEDSNGEASDAEASDSDAEAASECSDDSAAAPEADGSDDEEAAEAGASDAEAEGAAASGSDEEAASEVELEVAASDSDLDSEAGASDSDAGGAEPGGGRGAKRQREATAGSLASLKKQLAEAKRAKREPGEDGGEGPAREEELDDSVPLEQQRILTEEDFARIRELRQAQLVERLMRKHGLKSAAKRERLLSAAEDEAEAALERLEARGALGESRVDPASLEGRSRARKSKEERLASVLEGRAGRPGFGAAAGLKQKKTGGRSEKEKRRAKNLPRGARKAISARRAGQRAGGRKNFKGHH